MRQRVAMLFGAVLLGLVAIAFARLSDLAQLAFQRMSTAYTYAPLVVTPAIFALAAWATRRFFPGTAGSGIPQVIAASHNPGKAAGGPLLSLRVGLFKCFGTLAMLLSGGSVGREGPTVQISAAIMVTVHRWLRVPIGSGAIIAGGAAGVAAAFNTPLAGITFAIEELASAFEQKLAVLVMFAVVTSGLVSKSIAGDYLYFGYIHTGLQLKTALIAAPLAGVAGGLFGGLFSRLLIAASESGRPWYVRLKSRPALLAGGCGLLVAVVGISTDGLSWGTGYETTRGLLEGHQASLLFGPAKLLSTFVTTLSGAPGGIFAPSLSVGAGFGQLIALLMPDSPAGPIVMLGMVAYFTGVVRAPLTAVIILMEMTESRGMILPLFIAALIADQVSAMVCHRKLYHTLAQGFRPSA
ncbi:MAG: chloride channel protein [Novosphingobium sp.]